MYELISLVKQAILRAELEYQHQCTVFLPNQIDCQRLVHFLHNNFPEQYHTQVNHLTMLDQYSNLIDYHSLKIRWNLQDFTHAPKGYGSNQMAWIYQ